MKLKFFSLTLLLLICASFAYADPIVYGTSGTFGSTSTNTATFTSGTGSVTLTFNGITPSLTPTGNISLGTIVASAATGYVSLTDTFTLNISQSFPTVGGGSLPAEISGTVSIDLFQDNNSTITFSLPGSVTIGYVTYTPNPRTQLIVSPLTNGGNTTIQAVATTPEPASLALLGSGMIGLGGLVRRKIFRK